MIDIEDKKFLFTTAYLMGVYHEQQKNGKALIDIPYMSVTMSKLEHQQAQNQFQEYVRIFNLKYYTK